MKINIAIGFILAGTGLGLAISKQLVEQLEGLIGIDTELVKGSTFWFEIPCTCNRTINTDLL